MHHSNGIRKTKQNLLTKMVKMNPNINLEMVRGEQAKKTTNEQHFTIDDKNDSTENKINMSKNTSGII